MEIGEHTYTSNWVVANCRYDFLHGTPCHYKNNPTTDYARGTVTIDGKTIKKRTSLEPTIKVTNISAKKFRSIMREKKSRQGIEVYHISNMSARRDFEQKEHHDPSIVSLKKEFSSVFRGDLPKGLPPRHNIDHRIEIRPDYKPPHRLLFQLLTAELLTTKEYITGLLNKEKLEPANRPSELHFFLLNIKASSEASSTSEL